MGKSYRQKARFISAYAISLSIILFTCDLIGNVTYRIDIVETFFMGNEFTISYPKHPFISFWIAGFIFQFIPQSAIMITSLILQFALYIFLCYFTFRITKILKPDGISAYAPACLLACIFAVKHIQFTPDFFCLLFSTLFIWRTYLLLQNQCHKNYITVVALGVILFLTKYQAVLIYLSALLPFLLTKEGRKITVMKRSIFYGIAMISCIAVYLLYGFSHGVTSLKYAVCYDRFRISNTIPYIIIALLLGYKIYEMRGKLQNLNGIFIVSNGYGYYIITLAMCIMLQNGTSVRFFIVNLPFICIFLVYLFGHDISKINSKLKTIFIVLIITLCFVQGVYKSIDLNSNSRLLAHRHLTDYLNSVIGYRYDAVVQYNREFDYIYPHLEKKIRMVSLEMFTANEVAKMLRGEDFLVLAIPDQLGNMPLYVNEIERSLPEYQVIKYPMFFEEMAKKYEWQRSQDVVAYPVLFLRQINGAVL